MQLLKLSFILLLLTTLLTACASSLPNVEHFSPSASKIMIVGEIVLDPPLESEFEQQTYWSAIGDNRIINKIFMATGDTPIHVDINQLKLSEWQNMLETELGTTFFLETDRKRTYFKGAMIMLDAMTQDKLWFPGDLFFDVPMGADAIYIGTLLYKRDDFNNVTDMKVIDNFDEALIKVKQRLGNDIRLVPSLLKPVYKRPGQKI